MVMVLPSKFSNSKYISTSCCHSDNQNDPGSDFWKKYWPRLLFRKKTLR